MTTRTKVSISISRDLLDAIDEEAARRSDSRSGVIDAWLRLAARRRAARRLEEDTLAYYQRRTAEMAEEDEEWSRASARAGARLEID